jgi:hypothetical protein
MPERERRFYTTPPEKPEWPFPFIPAVPAPRQIPQVLPKSKAAVSPFWIIGPTGIDMIDQLLFPEMYGPGGVPLA